MKYLQVIGIWALIIPVAILNGGFRENVLVELGSLANPISGIMLSACIFAIAYFLIPKIKNCKKLDYILFGVIWFLLTNLFDLSMFIKAGQGIVEYMKTYDITSGNFWVLVTLTTLVSPFAVAKIKHRC